MYHELNADSEHKNRIYCVNLYMKIVDERYAADVHLLYPNT